MPSEINPHAEEKNEEHDLALRPGETSKANEEVPTEFGTGRKKSPLDNNVYSTKKTVAQGMMDIALLTANASQLKSTIKYHSDKSSPLFVIHIFFLSVSIFLQVVVGILLVMMSRYNINRPSHHSKAELLNNLTVIGILLITMVNVLASTLGDYS